MRTGVGESGVGSCRIGRNLTRTTCGTYHQCRDIPVSQGSGHAEGSVAETGEGDTQRSSAYLVVSAIADQVELPSKRVS